MTQDNMDSHLHHARTASDAHRRESHRSNNLEHLLYGDHTASRQRTQVTYVPRNPPRYSAGTRASGDADHNTGLLPLPQTDATLRPNMSKNITIDMDLGITKDVDLELEEFSRLRRLGEFTSAQRFLEENFSDRADDPYFFVLHAQLLLEMGDFRSFDKLRPTRVFGDMKDELVQKNQDLPRVSWNLLILLVMLPGRDYMQQAVNEIDKVLAFLEARVNIGSMEVCLK